MSAFAETALVYGALIGSSPTREQVAKITMTPDFEVRSMEERARIIMEMPAYAARYGLAMPEVEFINLGNGDILAANTPGQSIRIDAVSLGADNLAGTLDDGDVRTIEIYLNGVLKEDNMSNLQFNGFFYEYLLPDDLASGEYLVEVKAEDANGLVSRAQRSVVVEASTSPTISLTAPAVGEVLFSDEVVDFQFTSTESLSAYLEIDGEIFWHGRLGFDGSDLPEDESNFTLSDGTGRDSVTFEFDTDQSPSFSLIEDPEPMVLANENVSLASSGTYLGTTSREYLIEIDSDGTTADTFRWSLDGGSTFNESAISIPDSPFSYDLSAGVSITFDNRTWYTTGDRWRIQAGPVNEIVEVGALAPLQKDLRAPGRT